MKACLFIKHMACRCDQKAQERPVPIYIFTVFTVYARNNHLKTLKISLFNFFNLRESLNQKNYNKRVSSAIFLSV
jgi:hypothetical protein